MLTEKNMKKSIFIILVSTVLQNSLAYALVEQCEQASNAALSECLNTRILPQLAVHGENAYRDTFKKLVQSQQLSQNQIQPQNFQSYYFPENADQKIEIVGQRIDGTGNFFSLNEQNFRKQNRYKSNDNLTEILEKNLIETFRFMGFFHGRNFGRQNSFLFHIARVEISAQSKQSAEGILSFSSNILKVNLPQNRIVNAAELIKFWNDGNIFLTKNQAKLPRALLELGAKIAGGNKEKLGLAFLEHWSLFNPISDFRTSLHAIYLKNAGKVAQLLKNSDEQKLVGLLQQADSKKFENVNFDLSGLRDQMLENLSSPEYVATALDSFFKEDAGNTSEKNGSIHVVNRTTLMCLLNISNSHMIKVTWDESHFAERNQTVDQDVSVKVGMGTLEVNAKQKQDVHLVNNVIGLGFLCVDTNDNVQVNIDGLLGKLKSKMDQKSLIRMSLKEISI